MKTTSKIMIALGAGVVIGGVLGLLFAPDKGSETRKKVSEAGEKLNSELKNTLEKGKEMLASLKEEATEKWHKRCDPKEEMN